MNDTPPRIGSKGRFWPWAVAGLLCVTVVKYALVLAMIAGDPSMAIEENYYQKAIAWDETRVEQAASDALGWSARITIGPASGLPGRGEVFIALLDRAGAPIVDAEVTARVFHQARAARPFEETVRAGAVGTLRIIVPSAIRGLWQVELLATRGPHRFVETRTIIWGER